MSQRLDWDDVQFFLRVLEGGTVSGAAARLGVEHSTVVRRISRLEHAVGLTLFQRLPRMWIPTDAARSIEENALSMEQQVETLRRRLDNSSDTPKRVRVSMPTLLANEVLIPQLHNFIQEHPDTTLEIVAEAGLPDIAKNEAEIAVRLGQVDDPDLIARSLGALSYGIYGDPDKVGRDQSSWTWVGFDGGACATGIGEWYVKKVTDNRVSFRASDFGAMAVAATNGWGVALLPNFLAEQYPKLALLEADVPQVDIYLVSHRDFLKNQSVRELYTELSTLLAAYNS